VTISGLLFKLLAHEPFFTYLNDAEGGERLKALNLILADYESIYDDGELKIELVPGTSDMTRIEQWTLYNFYSVFVEGIHNDVNDPEDDEVSIQPGMINVMTIHQAKGLEFEVVFVLRPDNQPSLNYTHMLEDLLDPFITRPTKPRHRSQELRAAEDAVRLFFVAYSRAKRLLILTGSNLGEWDRALGRDIQGNSIHTIRDLSRLGVHRL
jgi:DNA helicase II / ATP-dependent DNA helicase PcrA